MTKNIQKKDAAPSKSRPVVHRGLKFVHHLDAHVTHLISKSWPLKPSDAPGTRKIMAENMVHFHQNRVRAGTKT